MATITSRFDTTTQHDLMVDGIIRRLFSTELKEYKSYASELYKMETTDNERERDREIGGLPAATELAEEQNIPLQKPVLGNEKEYVQRQWGTGFRMSHRMMKFNKYNLWQKYSKQLGVTMKRSKDVELHVPFNNTTSTSLTCGTGFDGLALASNAHTGILAGSTADNFDNLANAAPSQTALEAVRYYFATMVDSMGNLHPITPDLLVTNPYQWPTFAEIFQSEYRAHEDSNTKNVMKSYLRVYEDPLVTSTTAWFVLAKKSELYDIQCLTSMEPDLHISDTPDLTRSRYATSLQYYTYGWGDARSFYSGRA